MSGRSKFRKTGSADAHFEAQQRRLEDGPDAPVSVSRFVGYDFIPFEANNIVAAFNVLVTDWRVAIGRCLWRCRLDEDWVELPVGIGLVDPKEREEFLAALLAAARAYARSHYLTPKGQTSD
jgi:hypothetical protein